jgi:chromosome segregation ATPase
VYNNTQTFSAHERNLSQIQSDLQALAAGISTILRRLDRLEAQCNRTASEQLKDEWISGEEVMDLLSISRRTLQSYRDEGKLGFSAVGKKIYYRATEIRQHLEGHYQPPFSVRR